MKYECSLGLNLYSTKRTYWCMHVQRLVQLSCSLYHLHAFQQEDRERAAKSWRLIGHAANLLGVSESEWDCVRRLLAAIYHLGVAGAVSSKSGPLNFESCQFEKPGPAQKAAKLLGCPVGELRRYVFDPGMDDVGRRPPTNTAQDFTAEELLEGFVTGLYTEVVLIVSFFINR